jgi:hypothetical protein
MGRGRARMTRRKPVKTQISMNRPSAGALMAQTAHVETCAFVESKSAQAGWRRGQRMSERIMETREIWDADELLRTPHRTWTRGCGGSQAQQRPAGPPAALPPAGYGNSKADPCGRVGEGRRLGSCPAYMRVGNRLEDGTASMRRMAGAGQHGGLYDWFSRAFFPLGINSQAAERNPAEPVWGFPRRRFQSVPVRFLDHPGSSRAAHL